MSSPPQRALFIEYHHLYGRRPEFLGRFARGLGALGPSDEGQARGTRNALSSMDFLMLARATAGSCSRSMESGIIQRNGKPNPAAYAETTRADAICGSRAMRSTGSVGTSSAQRAWPIVSEFFSRLLNP